MSEPIQWAELTLAQQNRLIVEKVLGYDVSQLLERFDLLPYSQSMNAAWTLVDYLRKKGLDTHIASSPLLYAVVILERRAGGQNFAASAESAPEAICIAALRARGVEVSV